jgi:hypothetical protein
MITEQLWADFKVEPGQSYNDAFGNLMYVNTARDPVHVVVCILLEGPNETYVPKHMAPQGTAPLYLLD